MNIFHDSHDRGCRQPFGAVTTGSRVKLAADASGAERLYLVLRSTLGVESCIEMRNCEGRFRTEFTVPENPCLLRYFFIAEGAGGERLYYGNNPEKLGGIGCESEGEPEPFQITVYDEAPVPDWYKDALFYQIFPDRFAKGSGEERQPSKVAAKGAPARRLVPWDKKPCYEKKKNGDIKVWDFYGGSLKGITEKLDYLQSLGISGIYLNPIFEAVSNHRYDTMDYAKIDPLLGTEEDFRTLCAEAEKRGISIILDGVFNHCGYYSSYLKDHPEWFTVKEDGSYESWWGVKDLPEIREMEPSYVEYICGENGIVRKWLRAGARGFRLDVADNLPDEFIVLLRDALKAEKPDAVLMGEVWEDASNKYSHDQQRQYFYGHELDCVMNYPLRDALLSYINCEEPSVMTLRRIMSLMENYPPENFMANFNLLDSHDRARIITRIGGAEDPEGAKKKFIALSSVLYALPGVPVLYYGDEAGCTGGADPENRGTYPWGSEDLQLLEHFRLLGRLYKEHRVLTDGDFQTLLAGDDILAFMRSGREESVLVLANRSGSEQLYEKDCPGCVKAVDLLTGAPVELNAGRVSAHVPPMSAMLISLEFFKID